MKRLNSKIIVVFFLINILFSTAVVANAKDVELINIVNQQTMLSQRVAKAYLCVVNKIGIDDAERQLNSALSDFQKVYKKINSLTKSAKVKSFVKKSSTLKTLSKKPFTQQSAKSILSLSESVLGSSKSVASSLRKGLKKEAFDSITKSGQQQILAQRIAKYYIAYKSNIEGSKEKLSESIKLFKRNHQALMRHRGNTKSINKKLKKIDKLWKISHKLYNGRELPQIVLDATDDISKIMSDLTKLYLAKYI
jgi:hypothetical protein